VAALADFLALLLALAAGLAFYRAAADWIGGRFGLPHGLATAAGFLGVWLLALLILSLATAILGRLVPGFLQRSLPSRVLAVAPALAHGVLVAALAATLLVALPINGALKSAVLESDLGGPLVAATSVFNATVEEIVGGAVQDSLNLLTVHPASEERVDLNFRADNLRVDEDSEARMLVLVNEARREAGLRALRPDAELRAPARAHAEDMFRRGYFAHLNPEGRSPFDRLRSAGVWFSAAGENLALAPSVEIAHRGLMNSPGHRANLLSPNFGRVGIGVSDGGAYGKMFVQEFAD
jgi:uncharacterized protein YkwD